MRTSLKKRVPRFTALGYCCDFAALELTKPMSKSQQSKMFKVSVRTIGYRRNAILLGELKACDKCPPKIKP